MEAIVHSSYGNLLIDADDGRVICIIDRDVQGSEVLDNIDRFDLNEWSKFYAARYKEDEYDILDLGYWLKDGTYIEESRESFMEGE